MNPGWGNLKTGKSMKSYQQCPVTGLKKREGKKRNSPCTPYREKGKGKETRRGFLQKQVYSKTACAYAGARRRCSCSFAEAGAAADEIVGSCFGTMRDHSLWAWYCRHFDRALIIEKAHEYASMQRCGEIRNAIAAFQSWLRKEFGSKGGAI